MDMIKRVLEALAQEHVQEYLLEEIRTETLELFFVRRKLEMRRIKESLLCKVTVYNDFITLDGRKRGAYSFKAMSSVNDETLRKLISYAYRDARSFCNAYYDIPEGKKDELTVVPSSFNGKTLAESAMLLTDALFSADNHPVAFINSAELFVTSSRYHVVDSSGTDVAWIKNGAAGEFITQCVSPNDVEQFRRFILDELDTGALTQLVREALDDAFARARATTPPPAGECDLVLSDDNLRLLFNYWLVRSNAQQIYSKHSDFEIGRLVQGQANGDKLDLVLKAVSPYSSEGIPMRDLQLINGGILKAIWGDLRFCKYLGASPTGNYSRIAVSNGIIPLSTLKENALHVVSFSEFIVDPLSGNIGGEIRLGYLHSADGVRAVTGGSVNGNLCTSQSGMRFSAESQSNAEYEGPVALRLPHMVVSS